MNIISFIFALFFCTGLLSSEGCNNNTVPMLKWYALIEDGSKIPILPIVFEQSNVLQSMNEDFVTNGADETAEIDIPFKNYGEYKNLEELCESYSSNKIFPLDFTVRHQFNNKQLTPDEICRLYRIVHQLDFKIEIRRACLDERFINSMVKAHNLNFFTNIPSFPIDPELKKWICHDLHLDPHKRSYLLNKFLKYTLPAIYRFQKVFSVFSKRYAGAIVEADTVDKRTTPKNILYLYNLKKILKHNSAGPKIKIKDNEKYKVAEISFETDNELVKMQEFGPFTCIARNNAIHILCDLQHIYYLYGDFRNVKSMVLEPYTEKLYVLTESIDKIILQCYHLANIEQANEIYKFEIMKQKKIEKHETYVGLRYDRDKDQIYGFIYNPFFKENVIQYFYVDKNAFSPHFCDIAVPTQLNNRILKMILLNNNLVRCYHKFDSSDFLDIQLPCGAPLKYIQRKKDFVAKSYKEVTYTPSGFFGVSRYLGNNTIDDVFGGYNIANIKREEYLNVSFLGTRFIRLEFCKNFHNGENESRIIDLSAIIPFYKMLDPYAL